MSSNNIPQQSSNSSHLDQDNNSKKATIRRSPHDKEHPYAQISKKMLRDSSLSLKSKGLLCYLLSLTDNWKIYPKHLAKTMGVGRDQIYTCLNELMEKGYCRRQAIRIGNRISEWIYEISEEKCPHNDCGLLPENQDLENQEVENQQVSLEASSAPDTIYSDNKKEASESAAAFSEIAKELSPSQKRIQHLKKEIERLKLNLNSDDVNQWIKKYGIWYVEQTIELSWNKRKLKSCFNQAGFIHKALIENYFNLEKRENV